MSNRLPQAFDHLTTFRFHRALLLALTPVVVIATVVHGWWVLLTVALAVLGSSGADWVLSRLRRSKAPLDAGPPLWGVLLALLLPANAPIFLPLVGSFFMIFLVKGVFGGSGAPWINPVLAAWAFLQASWPGLFPGFSPIAALRTPFDQRATDALNTNLFSWLSIQLPGGYVDLLLGLGRPATALIVESGGWCLLLATIFLLGRGTIPWTVPASFFAAFALPQVLMGGDTLFQIFSGSLLLNLFFLATDPTSRPLGRWSLVAYGAMGGFLAFLIRTWGVGGDGVGYVVLLMNLVVPWIDQKFRRKSLNDFRRA